jgi:hypothetical protein
VPTLILEHLEKQRRWILEVEEAAFDIGRSRAARVSIADVSVSRRHLRIEQSRGRYRFRDLGSINGTYVNDLRLSEGPLHDGDELRIGKVRIHFFRERPPPQAAALEAPAVERAESLAEPAAGGGEAGGEGGDRIDDEDITPVVEILAARPEPLAPRRPFPFHLAIACLVLGFALGVVGGWLERAEPPARQEGSQRPPLSSGLETAPAPFAAAASKDEHPTPAALPRSAPSSHRASTAPWLALLAGPRLDAGDPEASGRAVVRLFIDALGRTPLRAELRALERLPPAERWSRLLEIAAESGSALDEAPDLVAARFLGVGFASAAAREELAAQEVEPLHLGALIVSSRFYAGREHRRRRSGEQRAAALWVDILDRLPARENTETVMEALRESADPAQVIRTLLYSPQAAAGPREGESAEEWLRSSYLRFLLRHPSAEERQATLIELERDPEGWRRVLLELALREEYAWY